jgi:hypothetical protein
VEPERFQSPPRGVDALATEPAEQLLRAVGGQRQAHGQPQKKNPDFHTAPLFTQS